MNAPTNLELRTYVGLWNFTFIPDDSLRMQALFCTSYAHFCHFPASVSCVRSTINHVHVVPQLMWLRECEYSNISMDPHLACMNSYAIMRTWTTLSDDHLILCQAVHIWTRIGLMRMQTHIRSIHIWTRIGPTHFRTRIWVNAFSNPCWTNALLDPYWINAHPNPYWAYAHMNPHWANAHPNPVEFMCMWTRSEHAWGL